MRTIISSMLMTLDGLFEGPGGEFVAPPWCDELTKASTEMLERADTIIYGRKSFVMNKAFWEQAVTDPSSAAAQMPAIAEGMNRLSKIVFSKTLPENPGWNGRVARGDAAELVAKLKKEPGKDLVMFGGAEIVSHFAALDLIDEYHFMLSPMVLGAGSPLFKGGHPRRDLELVEARPVSSGVVLLRYRRSRAA